jgi:predicted dehydrogenase
MTEFDGDWLIQTDKGCAVWKGADVTWEPAEGESGELTGRDGFPGFDRGGVLTELAAAVDGKSVSVLPTVQDNIKSLAMVFAAIRSVKEGRSVKLSEMLKT